MKLVFFDLGDPSYANDHFCDDNNETGTLETDLIPTVIFDNDPNRLYSNKIMNFYGNSLPLFQDGKKLEYTMDYVDICDEKNGGYEVVDKTLRSPIIDNQYSTCQPHMNEWSRYQPKWVEIDANTMANVCTFDGNKKESENFRPLPPNEPIGEWPEKCSEVSGKAITTAFEKGELGFMHLLGRRLGNTPLIEMVPNATILDTYIQQQKDGIMPGCISLAPGTRSGGDGVFNYRACTKGTFGAGLTDCYIGRWGWIGDRASLEDQIANAAHVEMNITSSKSYESLKKIHPVSASNNAQLVRYHETLCGPANAACQSLDPNSDLTEQEIRDMATYQRWIGIPNRSEYQVSSDKVIKGEKIFDDLKCSSCHVIKKIAFVYGDNMLPDEERNHLKELAIPDGATQNLDYPFVSYLGTDLLLHDMGYLSQVAKAPAGVEIRGTDGKVKYDYRQYVQYIRTPALKGLRFNRFVTDSNHNTKAASDPLTQGFTPGCDFLLHDGRACDAIEAAYLHDGPAVKELHMIEELNALSDTQLDQLRAFLYSL
jgi:hypothetical protein